MTMSPAAFKSLLDRLSAAACKGDGTAFAACFTPDAVYDDYIYGAHTGREEIAQMLEGLFHRDAKEYDWRFFHPVTDGHTGYASSLSRFVSTIPDFQGREVVIDGISRFTLKGGLIAHYHESVNGGVGHVQLGVSPARMEKVMQRWAARLRGSDEVKAYLKLLTSTRH